jgi:hypothetical protein
LLFFSDVTTFGEYNYDHEIHSRSQFDISIAKKHLYYLTGKALLQVGEHQHSAKGFLCQNESHTNLGLYKTIKGAMLSILLATHTDEYSIVFS